MNSKNVPDVLGNVMIPPTEESGVTVDSVILTPDIAEHILAEMNLESDRTIAQRFGQLKTELWRESVLLPDADLFIAATTLVHGSLLVTGDSRHYARIGGLRLERWT